jgi:hypothetical protein
MPGTAQELQEAVVAALGERARSITVDRGQVTVGVAPGDVVEACTTSPRWASPC